MNILKELYSQAIKHAWLHGISWFLMLTILLGGTFFTTRAIYNSDVAKVSKDNQQLQNELKMLMLLKKEVEAKELIGRLVPDSLPMGDKLILTEAIYTASRTYNISPDMIIAIIRVESEFNSAAVSSVGALGFMQVMPGTFTSMQRMYRIKGTIDDPYANIQAGAALLRYLFDKYKKDGVPEDALWVYVLFAYSTGKDYKHGTSTWYADRVFNAQQKLVENKK